VGERLGQNVGGSVGEVEGAKVGERVGSGVGAGVGEKLGILVLCGLMQNASKSLVFPMLRIAFLNAAEF
jgi:hypothetical protein